MTTDAGQGSGDRPFRVSFGYQGMKWSVLPTFVVNNNCPGAPTAATAVGAAAATWNAAVPPSAFRLVNGGTTSNTTLARDGVNRIAWRPEAEFSAGDVAVTSKWSTGDGTILECDIAFNAGLSWTTGTATGEVRNVEAVALHEFGHWLALYDLYGYGMWDYFTDQDKVMFGLVDEDLGNLNRKALHADDRAGIRWIYLGELPPVVAPVASFWTETSSGIDPFTVDFTDTSTNSPTSWTWSFGDGTTSALQHPRHTFGPGFGHRPADHSQHGRVVDELGHDDHRGGEYDPAGTGMRSSGVERGAPTASSPTRRRLRLTLPETCTWPTGTITGSRSSAIRLPPGHVGPAGVRRRRLPVARERRPRCRGQRVRRRPGKCTYSEALPIGGVPHTWRTDGPETRSRTRAASRWTGTAMSTSQTGRPTAS